MLQKLILKLLVEQREGNMKFEYNGNLLEKERVNLVADEITKKYPMISTEKAKEAAMLEGRISSDKTNEDELCRLYNIMLVNRDDKKTVIEVFRDFYNVVKDCYNKGIESIYLKVYEDIFEYLRGNLEFPFISDYI